jgi:hypothetical protein
MPDIRVNFGGGVAILTVSGDYKPGDPPPTGYSAREDWFNAQIKGGLRQVECPRCRRWAFPQELAPGGRICKPCAHPGHKDGGAVYE